jgi:hypothetical protein
MRIDHALCFAILVAFSGVLHAQSCAGGVGGGMGATGSECSDASWQTDGTALIARPIAAVATVPNVRSVEHPASGYVKTAGKKPRAAASVGVEEQQSAKQSARASSPIAGADRQLVVAH